MGNEETKAQERPASKGKNALGQPPQGNEGEFEHGKGREKIKALGKRKGGWQAKALETRERRQRDRAWKEGRGEGGTAKGSGFLAEDFHFLCKIANTRLSAKGGGTGVGAGELRTTNVIWFLGCCKKAPRTWYKQQKFIRAQIWRLEVQKQGASRAVLPTKALGENSPLRCPNFGWLPASLGVPWQAHTSLQSRGLLPFTCVCICVFTWPSYQHNSLWI